MSIDSLPTPRSSRYDQLSAAYRSTVDGILGIVNRCFCQNSLKCKPGVREESLDHLHPYEDRARIQLTLQIIAQMAVMLNTYLMRHDQRNDR